MKFVLTPRFKRALSFILPFKHLVSKINDRNMEKVPLQFFKNTLIIILLKKNFNPIITLDFPMKSYGVCNIVNAILRQTFLVAVSWIVVVVYWMVDSGAFG